MHAPFHFSDLLISHHVYFRDLPLGYNVGVVSPEMTDLIRSRSGLDQDLVDADNMRETLQWGHPSVSVFDKDGAPVSWAMQDYCGFVSNLYTEEKHRGKGIGAFVLARLTELILERDGIAYSIMLKDNETSRTLHEKVGFKRCSNDTNFAWMHFSADTSP